MNLRLDWCSHEAVRYANKHWHYSDSLPSGKLIKIGVWEGGEFIGVIIYSDGASPNLLKPYKLSRFEGCELSRIALKEHKTEVSKMISISLKMLKGKCPKLKLVISFADQNQNHHGGIYQSANWIFAGNGKSSLQWFYNGRWIHQRSMGAIMPIRMCENIKTRKIKDKYKYLYPLDKKTRKQIELLSKPYPKKNCDSGVNRSTPSFQDGGSGAVPTESLHLNYA